jgi:winged helix DNA-binding protein
MDILSQRLRNQKLVRSDLRDPAEIVAWLGAVQSQDYPGAKWALKLRGHGSPGFADADLDRAFDEGAILRTHILRPTWHFVAPADIRWMLSLTGPRVMAGNRHYCRKNGLDDKTLARSRRVLERSLGGRKHMTRTALAAVLERAGIPGDGQRLAYLMMDAELEQVICSGPRQGKQFTYGLLDERAPRARALAGDEALAELTKRYFASHGPATVRDFVWWSGLTVKHAKTGLAMLGRAAVSDTLEDLTYWSVPSSNSAGRTAAAGEPVVHLLPNYDELMNALRDRDLFLDPSGPPPRGAFEGFPHQLAIDGILRGAWRRTVSTRETTITVRPFRPFSKPEKNGLAAAVERYGTFVNLPAVFSLV